MKYEDIKNLSNADLSSKLREERKMQTKLKFAHAVSTLENPSKIKETKKVIARLLTETNVRKINQIKEQK